MVSAESPSRSRHANRSSCEERKPSRPTPIRASRTQSYPNLKANTAGEQYALPDAVGTLRKVRNKAGHGDIIAVSAADPLNLSGSITPGQRVPQKPNHRLLYRDGVPIATGANGQMALLESIDPDEEWRIRPMLLREQRPSAFHRSPRRSV